MHYERETCTTMSREKERNHMHQIMPNQQCSQLQKNAPSLRIVINSPSHFMDEAILGCSILFTFI